MILLHSAQGNVIRGRGYYYQVNKYIINNLDVSYNSVHGSVIYSSPSVKTFTIEDTRIYNNNANNYITYAYSTDKLLMEN